MKVLHSICQQIWKTQQWPQDWKRSVFIPISRKGNAKEFSNYRTIALISHASKVMLKILQARLQQYVNRELPDVGASEATQKWRDAGYTGDAWALGRPHHFLPTSQCHLSCTLNLPGWVGRKGLSWERRDGMEKETRNAVEDILVFKCSGPDGSQNAKFCNFRNDIHYVSFILCKIPTPSHKLA